MGFRYTNFKKNYLIIRNLTSSGIDLLLAEFGPLRYSRSGWGIIPAKDYDFLKKEGVIAVFGPGTILSEAACEILNQLLQEE